MAVQKTDYQKSEQSRLFYKITKNKFFLQSEYYVDMAGISFGIAFIAVIIFGFTFNNIYASENAYENFFKTKFTSEQSVFLTPDNEILSMADAEEEFGEEVYSDEENKAIGREVSVEQAKTHYGKLMIKGIPRIFYVFFGLFAGILAIILIRSKKVLEEKSDDNFGDKYISGANIQSVVAFKALQEAEKLEGVEITSGIKFNKKLETVHALYLGSSGTGKSVKMKRVYQGFKKRKLGNLKQRFIVHDVSGEWVTAFYNPKTDFILNPLDVRTINFDIFDLMDDKADVSAVIASLIPEGSGKADPIWGTSARNIFEAILYSCFEKNMMNNEGVVYHLSMGIPKLVKALKGVEGAEAGLGHIANYAASGQADNLYSNFSVYMDFFKTVTGGKGEGVRFKLKEWLLNGTGTIFLVNSAKLKTFNTPVLTLFIDSAIRIVLDFKEDHDRRVFVFLDEFGQLKKMPAIIDGLTLGRKKGLSLHIGIQEVSNIEEKYDKNLKATILNNIQTRCLHGVGEPESAEFVSKWIGEVRKEITNTSNSLGTEDTKDGTSFTTQIVTERAVLAPDVMLLKEHEFFYFQRGFGWARIQGSFSMEEDVYPEKEEYIIQNEKFSLDKYRIPKPKDDEAESFNKGKFHDIDEDDSIEAEPIIQAPVAPVATESKVYTAPTSSPAQTALMTALAGGIVEETIQEEFEEFIESSTDDEDDFSGDFKPEEEEDSPFN